jgi:hypothetical protein
LDILTIRVIYRHIILTVPAMFRTTFYQNAAVLLRALMRCGVQCLDDFSSEVRGKALQGGSIGLCTCALRLMRLGLSGAACMLSTGQS